MNEKTNSLREAVVTGLGLALVVITLRTVWVVAAGDMGRVTDFGAPWLMTQVLQGLGLDVWNPHPFLRLPFDLSSVAGRESFEVGHLLTGNRLRRGGQVVFDPDLPDPADLSQVRRVLRMGRTRRLLGFKAL